MIKHNHHIVPKHMGGSNDPSNLIELTIDEHAEAHRVLYENHNKREDYIAWKALSGQMSNEELWLEKSRLGGFAQKGKTRSEKSKLNYKESWTEERKKHLGKISSERLTGVPKSEQHKNNMRGKRPHVIQSGKNNNNAKPVMTPYGFFGSTKDCHNHLLSLAINIKYSTMMYKFYSKKDGWNYIEKGTI